MNIPDNQVALGNYTPEILSTIKTRSGKFWMLEAIAENPELVAKLKKLRVIIGATNPTLLLPQWESRWCFFRETSESGNKFSTRTPKIYKRELIPYTWMKSWWYEMIGRCYEDSYHSR